MLGKDKLYHFEWPVYLICFRRTHLAYRRISLEREAYANQGDFGYLKGRGWFNFLKYL